MSDTKELLLAEIEQLQEDKNVKLAEVNRISQPIWVIPKKEHQYIGRYTNQPEYIGWDTG